MTQPSSSEEIIASLINDVQNSNTVFDVKYFVGTRSGSTEDTGRHRRSSKSSSNTPKKEKKEKRHKEKKTKKSKKWKRTPSRSRSPRKKKKRRERSRSESHETTKRKSPREKPFSNVVPVSVTDFEKISDDDDLPVGADFRMMNSGLATMRKDKDPFVECRKPLSPDINKRREFVPSEEVFPLSKTRKKRDRSESPLPLKNKIRPISEILAKVRSEKTAVLLPRNVKLKNDASKGNFDRSDASAVGNSHADTRCTTAADTDVEYGPQPASKPADELLPVSDDDDDTQFVPAITKPDKSAQKPIIIGSLSKSTVAKVQGKMQQIGEDGEIPVSEESSTSSNERERVANGRNDRELKTEKDREEAPPVRGKVAVVRKHKKRREGTSKKKLRKEKRRQSEQRSSSSDSERQWKRLEGKHRSPRESLSPRPAAGRRYVVSCHSDIESDEVSDYCDAEQRRSERDYSDKAIKGSFRHNRRKSVESRESWHSHSRRDKPKGDSVHFNRSTKAQLIDHDRKTLLRNHGERPKAREQSEKLPGALWRAKGARRQRSFRNSFSPETKKHGSTSRSRSRSRSTSSSSRRSQRIGRGRSRHKKRSRRRSDGSSSEHRIDKKKLLEIAQRNAAQMAQLGYLPNGAPETAGQLKAGGQSVDQLVDFCQKLQRSQDRAERREKGEKVSSDEEMFVSAKPKGEEESDFVKHPFALKPAAPITINIANSVPLPTKTPTQRAVDECQLRLCYPVSSGQQHREKTVEWIPVEKEAGSSICVSAEKSKLATDIVYSDHAKAVNSTASSLSVSSDPFLLPPPPKPPVLLPSASSLLSLPPPPPPPLLISTNPDCTASPTSSTASATLGMDFSNVLTVPDDIVFQEPNLVSTPANVGKVMAKRIQARKRLSTDPNDFEAMKMLKEADEQMKAWAMSKNLPGKFNGTTGAHILSADQLGPEDPRYNAWIKKDLFKSANKVTSEVGLKLMQKMGWSPGEGLGKDRDGPLEPLTMDIKSDRKGLVALEELPSKKTNSSFGQEIAGKHPVSVLMELCSKKRWTPPSFTCLETGPPNNRRFLWKAVVNGVEYQPAVPSNNKKTGKAQACQVVLQSLGLVPRDPSLPVVI